MYLYIYDDWLQEKKYERETALIENRLTDLGISGKIIRLALFRSPEEHIYEEAKRGVTTVVVVGNDRTARRVLHVVADVGLPLGFIPLGSENSLATLFGIPNGVEACDVLSARFVVSLDAGRLNQRWFLTDVRVRDPRVALQCEGLYKVRFLSGGELNVVNLCRWGESKDVSNFQDGLLEARVAVPPVRRSRASRVGFRASRLPFLNGVLKGEDVFSVECDGDILEGTRFTLRAEQGKFCFIVGRDRTLPAVGTDA